MRFFTSVKMLIYFFRGEGNNTDFRILTSAKALGVISFVHPRP